MNSQRQTFWKQTSKVLSSVLLLLDKPPLACPQFISNGPSLRTAQRLFKVTLEGASIHSSKSARVLSRDGSWQLTFSTDVPLIGVAQQLLGAVNESTFVILCEESALAQVIQERHRQDLAAALQSRLIGELGLVQSHQSLGKVGVGFVGNLLI